MGEGFKGNALIRAFRRSACEVKEGTGEGEAREEEEDEENWEDRAPLLETRKRQNVRRV